MARSIYVLNSFRFARPVVLLLLAGVTGTTFFTGCAKSASESIMGREDQSQISVLGPSEAARLMELSSARCRNLGDCPGSVGMLVSASDHSVGMCTAFLIGRDTVMTNSHCIPADLRASGASCGGRIKMVFPMSVQFHAEQADCAKVISASEPDVETASPDHAFLRLSRRVSREVLKLSAEGVADNLMLRNPKMDLISRTRPYGEIRVEDCRAIQNSALLPIFDGPFSQVLTLGDCGVRPGNSGSPLLDASGKVRAIIQSGWTSAELASLVSIAYEAPAAVSVATNMGCLAAASPGPDPLPAACGRRAAKTSLAIDFDRAIGNLEPEVLKGLRERMEEWRKNQAKFRWKLSKIPSGAATSPVFGNVQYTRFMPVPECFANSFSWLKKFRRLGFYEAVAEERIGLPVWKARMGLNRHIQPVAEIVAREEFDALLRFSPQNLHRHESSPLSIVSYTQLLFSNQTTHCD